MAGNQPNYRRGICCANCHYYSPQGDYCTRFGGSLDFVGMCDDFMLNATLEGVDPDGRQTC
jgi:hypothetical protein